MKWKSTLAAAATLALVTSLVGCSSSGGGKSPDSGPSSSTSSAAGSAAGSAPRKFNVVFVPGDLKDAFWITMSCAVKAEAAKYPDVNLSVQAPEDGTAPLQKTLVDSIVATHPDLLEISADDSTAMQAPIAAAAAAGIKVVFVNNPVVDPSFAVSQVLSNDTEGGEDAFKLMKELHPDGGKVLVIGTEPGFKNTDDRVTGFANAIKADSKFTYLGVQYGQNSPQKAAQIVAAALQKDPDIVGIFANNINGAEGTVTGLREVGKAKSVDLITYDAEAQQVTELKDGIIQGLIAQQPSTMGAVGLQQGLAALRGEPVTKLIRTPLTILNQKNVDTLEKTAAYHSSCS